MRTIAWILLILSCFGALRVLGVMLFGDDAGVRFFALFLLAIQAISVYVSLTYLYFAHTPHRWAIIVAGVANGVAALLALTDDEAFSRISKLAVNAFLCVGFFLLL